MIELHALTRVAAAKYLRLVARNPDPTPWEADVEEIVLGRIATSHVGSAGSWLLAASADRVVVGAALHCGHESLSGAQYLAGVLLDRRHRGRGLGHELVSAAIADAAARSGHDNVVWVVHPDNAAMLDISHRLATELGVDPVNGYVQFVYP